MSQKSAFSKDLQINRCTGGLDKRPTGQELVEPLETEEEQTWLPPTPRSQDDPAGEAQECSICETALNDGSRPDNQNANGAGPHNKITKFESEKPLLVLRNPRGRRFADLAASLDELEKALATQAKELATRLIRITSLEQAEACLTDQVRCLTISSRAYQLQRDRFISTFKSNILMTATEDDIRIIAEGRLYTHQGDAIADAALYKMPGGRRDFATYLKLYGLPAQVVQDLRHCETIDLLNCHARVISSKLKKGSDSFYTLFRTFVKLFRESGNGYDEGYLVGDPTDVTRGYWAFMECIKTEVSSVEYHD